MVNIADADARATKYYSKDASAAFRPQLTIITVPAGPADTDGDGVLDTDDAFPLDVTEWLDTDSDGTGNNADTDDDNDGVLDTDDALPLDATESVDTDGDGIGDNSDPDIDGDGVPNDEDPYPLDPTDNGESIDTDGDGVSDADDAFPLDATESVDSDGDGIGNNADTDDDGDGDGVLDTDDAFPLDATESIDTDNDGTGNNADTDDDNDAVKDLSDAFPLDATESVDTDNDGLGNNADTDDDNDGVEDYSDGAPLDSELSNITINQLFNGDLEQGSEGWLAKNIAVIDTNAVSFNGSNALRILSNSEYKELSSLPINGVGVEEITLNFRAKMVMLNDEAVSSRIPPRIAIRFKQPNGNMIGYFASLNSASSEWTSYSLTRRLTGDSKLDLLDDGDGDISNDIYNNDISVSVLIPADEQANYEVFVDDMVVYSNNDRTTMIAQSIDSDGDGTMDYYDAFPLDDSESIDTDADNRGNNADTDDDNDGVEDFSDAFPLDATESLDTDNDGIGNNADTDDDGDGIIDENDDLPLDGTESLDTDGDGVGDNIDPDIDGDNVPNDDDIYPLDPSRFADTTKPVFNDDILTIVVNATGALTDISDLVSIPAIDNIDGEIVATIDGETNLPSGAHNITVSATDAAGNSESQEVTLHITPQLLLSEDKEVVAGSETSVTVKLSGSAAVYPVTLDYTLSGDAVEQTSNTLTFTSEMNEQALVVKLLADATVFDIATLTLDAAENVQLPATSDVTLTIVARNEAPQLTLTQQQAGNIVSVIDADAGPVTVTASINDINPNDLHDINWYSVNDALFGSVEDDSLSFVFDPTSLVAGSYQLSVNATENNTDDNFSVSVDTNVVVVVGVPELSDETDSDNDGISDSNEGFSDSDGDGIPDYLDDNSNTSQLPIANSEQPLQTLNGLQLTIGRVALSANALATNSASISADNLTEHAVDASGLSLGNTQDDDFTPLPGAELINFIIKGVPVGESAPVVYPLPSNSALTADAVYRKYTPANGWVNFVSDSNNNISSAMASNEGICPAPLDDSYTEGLTAGDNCLQLQIEDGGIYDADGEINGQVEDPGLLALANQPPVFTAEDHVLTQANVGVPYSVDISNQVSDADNDILSFALLNQPSWLSISENGVLSGLATNDVEDISTLEVLVTDTKGETASTTMSISVNKAPAFITNSISLATASRNVAYSDNIATQVSETDGDSYTVNKLSGPYWLTVSETGELSGTPHAADIGDNKVTVELIDTKGAKTNATFTVTVDDSDVRASKAGSFSATLFTILGLVSLRRRKQK